MEKEEDRKIEVARARQNTVRITKTIFTKTKSVESKSCPSELSFSVKAKRATKSR